MAVLERVLQPLLLVAIQVGLELQWQEVAVLPRILVSKVVLLAVLALLKAGQDMAHLVAALHPMVTLALEVAVLAVLVITA